MKVLFLTLYPPMAASARYRVHQFIPHLREAGIECEIWSAMPERWYAKLTGAGRRWPAAVYHLVETPRRLLQIIDSRLYDVVVVQKALLTAYARGFATLLRSRARKIVLDIDDAVHLMQPQPLRTIWDPLIDPDQVKQLMRESDLVLAGNAWLAQETRNVGGKALIFPTVVDVRRFVPQQSPPGIYRIGWMGSPGTARALATVAKPLERIANAEIVLVGAGPHTAIHRAERREWTLQGEVDQLQTFSVGIMPLEKTEWDRGKCALKALQYMACGVPCIATPFGAITDIIEHGVNGLFADTPDEWTNAIERLREAKIREEIGHAARAVVETRFSLRPAADNLVHILESVA